MRDNPLMVIYRHLFERFGPQHWWPGETPFEVIVGAILTQNTAWTNVEKAIGNLKQAGAMTPLGLRSLSMDELAECIRPAGYFNVKARRLANFLAWLFEACGGDLDAACAQRTDALREQLLAINGIGPETADSILLYAFNKPVFVIDAYTCRILGRHRLLDGPADYESVREMMESGIPRDTALYNEYHALLVRLGKEFCKPRPRCQGCPLEDLPHDVEMADE
ncbi:MAG: endonuclease III domain-containing protein [Phycisphaerae bacterium]|nr:endonuclease III domain-containing protein [Phycisphaerae bacterium]